MDVTSLISNASDFAYISEENPLNGLLNVKIGPSSCGKQDALEAVKLDPAVLEAQVTVHSKDSAASGNGGQNVSVTETKREIEAPSPYPNGFEDMVLQQEAALLSLAPHQLELLMKYADTLRRQRVMNQRQLECAFCKNNGKPMFWYTSHVLKDCRGRVQCPVLRGFQCRRCGATGDRAHTIKYCPDSLTDSQSSCSENLLL